MYDKDKSYKPESRITNNRQCITTFRSIGDFVDYVDKTATNTIYAGHESDGSMRYERDGGWTGAKTFDEARELLRNGYREGTDKLKQLLKAETKDEANFTRKMILDVVGFQPVVANYLMGVPQNMINSKMVAKKQKVITINKDISYHAGYSNRQIFDYSTKTLRIINALEAQGYAINLNVMFGVVMFSGDKEMVRIRIKNANERMNLQKLSFPLVHTAMLRRMIFRYMEVTDTCTMRSYTSGYGYPMETHELKVMARDNKEIYLNREVTDRDVESIKKVGFSEK